MRWTPVLLPGAAAGTFLLFLLGCGDSRDDHHPIDLPLGQITYTDPPDTVPIDSTFIFELVLTPEQMFDSVEMQVVNGDSSRSAIVRYSRRTAAALSGVGFRVAPEDHQVQYVEEDLPTHWEWDVTAVEHGPGWLRLQLFLMLDIDGVEAPRIKTFRDTIFIYATPVRRAGDWLRRNWPMIATILTVILVPLAGYLWRRRRKRKKPDPSWQYPL